MIDDKYLRFTRDEMRRHFLVDAEGQIEYFEKSAKRYREFLTQNPETRGIPITASRLARQIEKDERFWTAASLKHVFDHANRNSVLEALLCASFGDKPPVEGLDTWGECLTGDLALYFEAQAPSPRAYVEWLRQNVVDRHCIPYVLDAAARTGQRALEGPTHLDAVLVNPSNGFSLLVEAKVLSDISPHVAFDVYRNQLARCIDVMLERYRELPAAFGARRPERSLFALLTPASFRARPHSRLYGWLLEEYRSRPSAIARDLPHRTCPDWRIVASRLGWVTFEDIESQCPGACPWL
jgi:hypothetical protein